MIARVDLEPAWLLAQRPYRETSQLLEVFSATQGRVGLVARGVRSTRSKQRGALQPFRPLLLSWTGSGDLGTLTAAESARPAVALAGAQVFLGWYVNELLLRLMTRCDPHPALYPLYERTIAALPSVDAQAALRGFEVGLLDQLGYGLPLDGAIEPDRRYDYDPEHGAVPEEHGSVSGAALMALRQGRYADPDTRREVQAVLRMAIDRQLGGRPLESRRLWLATHRRATT